MNPLEELIKQAQALNENKEYQKVIELLPDSILETYNSADLYAEKACAYGRLKNFELSNNVTDKVLSINPKHAKGNHYKGNYYYHTKDYEKAKEFYNKAIKNDPKFVYPYVGLGIIYHDLKDYEKAKEFYSEAAEIDPKFAHSYNGLGIIYHNKDYEKAKKFYNKAIKNDPKLANPYYNLGNIYYNLKDYNKSLAAYKKYVELTQNSPDYYTSIAESRIAELKKLIENTAYSSIRELVDKIKDLLLYKEDCITHYTSLSVTKALILKNCLFRLSEGAFLNDTSEGRELFNFLSFHFSSQNRNDTVAELFAQKPFIGSFVAEIKHDDLTLWRMYGKEEKEEAKGCAITIDREKLLENLKDKLIPDTETSSKPKTDEEFSFYKVAYRKEGDRNQFIFPGANKKQEKAFNEYMNELSTKVKEFDSKARKEMSDTQNLVELLNEIAYLFKSAEYQYEHEIRLVIKGVGFKKIVSSDLHPPRVYIKLVSIRPLIQKITLGPKVERADEWASAFYYSLDSEGYHPDILISHLPFK